MNEDVFNASIRKFLKTLGVTAQREIEKAVRKALEDGKLKGSETFPAFTAHEFLLYQAFLGSGGSRCEIRERFSLAER